MSEKKQSSHLKEVDLHDFGLDVEGGKRYKKIDSYVVGEQNFNPISIGFENINLTLNENHILKDVTGKIEAGKLMGIMGTR